MLGYRNWGHLNNRQNIDKVCAGKMWDLDK